MMRSLAIVFLLVGVSHGYFGPVNTANGVQFAANFLWDSVFSPTYDTMIEGAQSSPDDKIASRSMVPQNALSNKFAELVARFQSNLHHLYESLFLMVQESLADLQEGEENLEDKIRSFYDKIDAIHKQINEWAAETKYELEMHAVTVQGDWVNILNQYSQNIDLSFQAISSMFQKLTQDLMKNLLEVALSAVPNALNIIENMKKQGLLSFFHS